MRVALVRGQNLNAWELENFDLPSADVVAFGSRNGAFGFHGHQLPVRRLPSFSDALSRAPRLAQAATARFAGPTDHLLGLERALRGFDIAHVAELRMPYSAQALRAREQGACARVVATVWENIPLLAPESRRVADRVERVAAGVDHFIAISERARLHLTTAGVPDDRITVQPMGVNLERFRPGPASDREPDRPIEIVSVARLVAEKGVEDLVVAVALAHRAGVPVRLRLVGTGPLENRLRHVAVQLGIREAVAFSGLVPHAELPDVYRRADVFVLASGPRSTWREQFGFAVVEAMACGLPVIAGDSGSLAEVVADRDSLVAPHDPPTLAERIVALAGSAVERARQGERNRGWAERRYDRHQVARAIEAVYRDALARPARHASGAS